MPTKKTTIDSVYGIVYGVRSKTTRKLYIGQTLSHQISSEGYWNKYGVKARIKQHNYDANHNRSNTKFFKDILKYGIDDFKIFEIKKCPGIEINMLDELETNIIKQYETLDPFGYNTRLNAPAMSKGKKLLMEHYKLKFNKFFEKKTSGTKEECFKGVSKEELLSYVQCLDIEYVKVTAVPNNNQARVYVKTITGRLIRVNFAGGYNLKNAVNNAIVYANLLSEKPIISDSSRLVLSGGETYKYQGRVDKFKEANIRLITGNPQFYKSHNNWVYLLLIYTHDKKTYRTTFGGKTQDIEVSYNNACEFIDKLAEANGNDFERKLKNPQDVITDKNDDKK